MNRPWTKTSSRPCSAARSSYSRRLPSIRSRCRTTTSWVSVSCTRSSKATSSLRHTSLTRIPRIRARPDSTSSTCSTLSILTTYGRSWPTPTMSVWGPTRARIGIPPSQSPSFGRRSSSLCPICLVSAQWDVKLFSNSNLYIFYITERSGKTIHLLKSGSKKIATDRKRKKFELMGTISQYKESK